MDGLFELLILAVFVLFPMIDALRRRKRRGDGPVDLDRPGGRGKAGAGSPSASRGSADRERSADRDRSAEELVPADLWAVLTGQKEPEGRPELPDVYRRKEEGAESYDDQVVGDEATSPETGRRSSPGSIDDHSWTEVGQRGEIGSGDAGERGEELEELGGLIAGRSLQRAGRSLDRAARLGGTGSLGSGLADAGSGAHPFFHDLDRNELRRAIVLKEVLGPPLAIRDE